MGYARYLWIQGRVTLPDFNGGDYSDDDRVHALCMHLASHQLALVAIFPRRRVNGKLMLSGRVITSDDFIVTEWGNLIPLDWADCEECRRDAQGVIAELQPALKPARYRLEDGPT